LDHTSKKRKNLRFFDLQTGKTIGSIDTKHTNLISGIAVSPNGKYVVTASRDSTLKVWEISSMKLVCTAIGLKDWCTSCQISADSKWFFSTSEDDTLRIWDILTGKQLFVLDRSGYFAFTDNKLFTFTTTLYDLEIFEILPKNSSFTTTTTIVSQKKVKESSVSKPEFLKRIFSKDSATKQELKKEKIDHEVKVLLVGSSRAGKSTLLRCAAVIQSNEQLNVPNCIEIIREYVIKDITNIAQEIEQIESEQESVDLLKQNEFRGISPKIIDAARKVAKIPSIMEKAPKLLDHDFLYFLSRIDDIFSENYIPTITDYLRMRVRINGLTETSINIQGSTFRLVAVGGQRNERKKWVNSFENLSCVLAVIDISSYDQTLYEDSSALVITESLLLLKEMCSNKFTSAVPKIILLNKMDLLKEKIHNVDPNITFKDYTGGKDINKFIDYFSKRVREIAGDKSPILCCTAIDINDVKDKMDKMATFISTHTLQSLKFGSEDAGFFAM